MIMALAADRMSQVVHAEGYLHRKVYLAFLEENFLHAGPGVSMNEEAK